MLEIIGMTREECHEQYGILCSEEVRWITFHYSNGSAIQIRFVEPSPSPAAQTQINELERIYRLSSD